MKSIDLINCKEGRGEIPIFYVGRGEEMNSSKNSDQQGVLMEEDQRNILIIGGIEIVLPRNLVEARACVVGVATKGQLIETVKEEEEKEKTLMISPAEEEEHLAELRKIFSQESEQGITTVLEATEAEPEGEEADIIDFGWSV